MRVLYLALNFFLSKMNKSDLLRKHQSNPTIFHLSLNETFTTLGHLKTFSNILQTHISPWLFNISYINLSDLQAFMGEISFILPSPTLVRGVYFVTGV